jgi:outer membrane protein
MKTSILAAAALPFLLILATPAVAQSQDDGASAEEDSGKAPRRYRVGAGPQFVPAYPGADKLSIRPYIDLSRTRGDEPFEFEAPDESFGFSLTGGRLSIGPALNFESSRKPSDVGIALDKVKTTIEAGAFVELEVSEAFRLRAEGRKGLGGHDGWTGQVGADFVTRDGDNYLFSIGPRATLSDGRYHEAYFGVNAAEAARTGLAAYAPDGGLQAVGAAASFLTELGGGFGISSYAKYDRLVGDAGRSPVVRGFGSRDQFSGGLALTYTFGGAD